MTEKLQSRENSDNEPRNEREDDEKVQDTHVSITADLTDP
jgi:hypothetical protein